MEFHRNTPPLWDFTSAPNPYPQMPDLDFMSMLEKQFPGSISNAADGLSFGSAYNQNPNPLNTSNIASSSRTSPSDESPSPTASLEDSQQQDEVEAPAAKRKATEDVEEGPSSKNQHTMKASSASTSSRRKSTGNPAKDETRLMKRKEQNRAAQRAFRERKEKHVKDLEDKVAQLEAKNEEAVHENENLRDLLNRLQTENVMLKRGQFTFSMPRDGLQPFSAELTSFAQPLPSSPTQQTNFAVPSGVKSPKLTNPLDWSSLTTFDPSRLNLLDDIAPSQTTATDSAMQLDFGFGSTGLASNTPYTTLASNPMFMSFASSFDATSPQNDNSPNLSTATNQPFDFDLSSLTAWPSPPNGQDGFDDLLQGYIGGGNNNNNNGGLPSFLTSPASVSPLTHHVSPAGLRTVSSSSSPSSSSTDPLFTPKDVSTPESDGGHRHDECPKTRAELAKRIDEAGPSPFAPACNPAVRKSSDGVLAMISCEGTTSFPKTQKNESNIEVLSAWRSITSNPKFKDTDISELCAEFTAKARCDGTKVVLEPSGVHSIIESLSKKQQQK